MQQRQRHGKFQVAVSLQLDLKLETTGYQLHLNSCGGSLGIE